MIINPIASSSLANSYIVDDGRIPILIEAGIRLKEIRVAAKFRLSSFGGCLISHSHQDHCRAVKDLIKFGLNCYMTRETADKIEVFGHRVKIIEPASKMSEVPEKQFGVGSWQVVAFPTRHDCDGSVGYLLVSGKEKLVFATDTAYLPVRFSGVTHLMVECNYVRDVLDRNVEEGRVDFARKQRLIRSHFSLENLVQMLKANDWSELQECRLLHLSKENSHEEYIRRTVQGIIGRPVYICKE